MERSAFQKGAHYLGLQARAGTADSFEKLIQEMFAWTDAEASSNMGVLFPQGLERTATGQPLQLQQQAQPCSSSNTACLGISQQRQVALTGVQPVPSPGMALTLVAAAAATPAAAAAGSLSDFAAAPGTRSHGSSTALTSPFSGLAPELLLGSEAGRAVTSSAAAAAGAGARKAAAGHLSAAVTASPAAAGMAGMPAASGTCSVSSGGTTTPIHSSLWGGEENLQQLLQQQLVMQQALQAPKQSAAAAAAAAEAPRKGRRGRPPKADGQYSTAYAALKKYRARKRSELEDMEAEVAAKLAQLAALQQENQALRHKQEALESTIVIQDRVVAQLSALQLEEQQQAASAAAAAAAGVAGASSCASRGVRSSSSSSTPADVSALLAAVTGEPQPEALGPASGLSGPSGLMSGCQDHQPEPDVNNPDWAGITSSIIAAQRVDSGPQLGMEQLNVPMLMERYKAYVASAAAALQNLAAVLQQQQPAKFPPSMPVPPAALGSLTPEEAGDLGAPIPHAPFRLAEFLAVGNDEKLPPALPAINLLTEKHESIEPQIWRVVATQLTLRPGQAEKLAAAWSLYNTSLNKVNEERAGLMRRLQDALDICHRSSAAADAAGVGLSEGGLRLGLDLASPNDCAMLLSDEKLLDDVLNQHEYWELAEAIDANMAREDQIMILFDYAIFMLLDELQLAQVVVSSWPFFPLMGSICTWLLEDAAAAVARH